MATSKLSLQQQPLGLRLQPSSTKELANPIYEIITDDHRKSPVEEPVTSYEEMITAPEGKMTPKDVVTPEVELTQIAIVTVS